MKSTAKIILMALFFSLSVCPPNPIFALQQGDWIDDPFEVSELPFFDYGNTCQFLDDIDFTCPYTGPAPDVVYRYVPAETGYIVVDLCGSEYDTQVFITNTELDLIACNDDHYFSGSECGSWVSRLDNVEVLAGNEYYIFVDGAIYECGDYFLAIYSRNSCDLGGQMAEEYEGEDDLGPGYVDEFNSGCDGVSPDPLLLPLSGDYSGNLFFSGTSGWCGYECRDTDWFQIFSNGENFELTIETEQPLWLVATVQTECDFHSNWVPVFIDSCEDVTFLVEVAAEGQQLWVGLWPVDYYRPLDFQGWQFQYFVEFSGVAGGNVRSEDIIWGDLKAKYR